jgi:PleD family two-component response regulator
LSAAVIPPGQDTGHRRHHDRGPDCHKIFFIHIPAAGASSPAAQRGLFQMPLRILVVEDHAPFRHLICAELQRRAEFQTIEAADGLEAVQMAEKLQPDLILLDLNLPKMHGFEVAEQIRRLAPCPRHHEGQAG